jgi:uncharacterized protein YdhG (YjbR/CyaY superfamily)
MSNTFSKEEKAAIKATAAEAKAAREGADLAAACDAAIAAMTGLDRELAEIIHGLVTKNTDLKPKTYYGMPAYTNAEGKVIVFFQNASKFKVRYATLGFQPDANLDAGNFWPTGFAVTKLSADDQKQVLALIKKAAG